MTETFSSFQPASSQGAQITIVTSSDAVGIERAFPFTPLVEFTDLGETESPACPDDANVFIQEEAQQRIMETLMSGAMGSD